MLMQVIPTRVHGIVDYIEGPALLVAPGPLGLGGAPASAAALRLAGAGGAAYSAAADYGVGIVRAIPMAGHLAPGPAAAAGLAASPWLLGFAGSGRRYWLPHVLVGAAKATIALTTKIQPSDKPVQ